MMNFWQFLENIGEDYPDGAFILYKPYQHPPNMDIVEPALYEDGELYGWKSLITGLSTSAWPDEDQIIEMPKAGWRVASEVFKKPENPNPNP